MSKTSKEASDERLRKLDCVRKPIVSEVQRVVSCAAEEARSSRPHIVVVGNHKGGSGKSTIALHVVIALLKAGKRVASIDLDVHQQTLTHYIENRREWGYQSNSAISLPHHCSMERNAYVWTRRNEALDLARFMSHLTALEDDHNYDFVVIDTPGGVQELSLIAHGMADTLITPINDSLIDLDAIVAIDLKDQEPRPSQYAMTVARALEARKSVCGRSTDWIIVRNRMARLPSRNDRQIEDVLAVMSAKLGFRVVRGLSECPVFREFFAAGLTALDPVEVSAPRTSPSSLNLSARVEVCDLIDQTGLLSRQAVNVLVETVSRPEGRRRNKIESHSAKNTRSGSKVRKPTKVSAY